MKLNCKIPTSCIFAGISHPWLSFTSGRLARKSKRSAVRRWRSSGHRKYADGDDICQAAFRASRLLFVTVFTFVVLLLSLFSFGCLPATLIARTTQNSGKAHALGMFITNEWASTYECCKCPDEDRHSFGIRTWQGVVAWSLHITVPNNAGDT